jgi:hypothetical protein
MDKHKKPEHVVAAAVRSGYKVVEENIRQGRAAAERLGAGQYRMEDVPSEIIALAKRMMRLTGELGMTWFEFLAAVMRDPEFRNIFEARAPNHDATPTAKPPAAPVQLGARVLGRRRAEVIASSLSPLPAPAVPHVAKLRALDEAKPAIDRVSFRPADDGKGLVVVVRIPDNHPPGVYVGTIVDRNTHHPIGTLRVEVFP